MAKKKQKQKQKKKKAPGAPSATPSIADPDDPDPDPELEPEPEPEPPGALGLPQLESITGSAGALVNYTAPVRAPRGDDAATIELQAAIAERDALMLTRARRKQQLARKEHGLRCYDQAGRAAVEAAGGLRFAVGDVVECATSKMSSMWVDGWSAGTVTRQWYREDQSMAADRWAAYQVAIPTDAGTDLHPGQFQIMVPKDTDADKDKFCRRNQNMSPITERRAVSAGRDCIAAITLKREQRADTLNKQKSAVGKKVKPQPQLGDLTAAQRLGLKSDGVKISSVGLAPRPVSPSDGLDPSLPDTHPGVTNNVYEPEPEPEPQPAPRPAPAPGPDATSEALKRAGLTIAPAKLQEVKLAAARLAANSPVGQARARALAQAELEELQLARATNRYYDEAGKTAVESEGGLRFAVGAVVECATSSKSSMWKDGWSAGTVVRQWYREEESMAQGRWAAYQVAIPLDDTVGLDPGSDKAGRNFGLIFVPKDTDIYCRQNPSNKVCWVDPSTERRAVSAGRDALAQLKRLEAEVNKEVLKLGLGDTPSTDKLIQGWTGPAQLESGEVYWSCTKPDGSYGISFKLPIVSPNEWAKAQVEADAKAAAKKSRNASKPIGAQANEKRLNELRDAGTLNAKSTWLEWSSILGSYYSIDDSRDKRDKTRAHTLAFPEEGVRNTSYVTCEAGSAFSRNFNRAKRLDELRSATPSGLVATSPWQEYVFEDRSDGRAYYFCKATQVFTLRMPQDGVQNVISTSKETEAVFRKNYTVAKNADRQPSRKGQGQSKSQLEQRQKKMEQKKQLRNKQRQRLADTADQGDAAGDTAAQAEKLAAAEKAAAELIDMEEAETARLLEKKKRSKKKPQITERHSPTVEMGTVKEPSSSSSDSDSDSSSDTPPGTVSDTNFLLASQPFEQDPYAENPEEDPYLDPYHDSYLDPQTELEPEPEPVPEPEPQWYKARSQRSDPSEAPAEEVPAVVAAPVVKLPVQLVEPVTAVAPLDQVRAPLTLESLEVDSDFTVLFAYLDEKKLTKYMDILIENEADEDDLKECGIPKGPRIKILRTSREWYDAQIELLNPAKSGMASSAAAEAGAKLVAEAVARASAEAATNRSVERNSSRRLFAQDPADLDAQIWEVPSVPEWQQEPPKEEANGNPEAAWEVEELTATPGSWAAKATQPAARTADTMWGGGGGSGGGGFGGGLWVGSEEQQMQMQMEQQQRVPSPAEAPAAAPPAAAAPVAPGSWAAKAMKPPGPAAGAWGKPASTAQPTAAQTVPDLGAVNSFPGLGAPAAPVGSGAVSTIASRPRLTMAEMAASIPEPAPEPPSLLDVSLSNKVNKKALKKLRKQQQQAAKDAEAEASRVALAAMDSEKLDVGVALASLEAGSPAARGADGGKSGVSRRAQEKLEEVEKERVEEAERELKREKKEEEQMIKQRKRGAKKSWSKSNLETERHRSGASRRRMEGDEED